MMDSTASLTIQAQALVIADHYLPNGGRPSLVSDAHLVQVLLAALSDGLSRESACKVTGISKQTFYNALKRAESGDQASIVFVDAVEKAEASVEQRMSRRVIAAADAGPQYWAAGMTWLERKYPDRWGRRTDDSSVPKVVVQIGVKDSDISVTVNNISASATDDSEALIPREP